MTSTPQSLDLAAIKAALAASDDSCLTFANVEAFVAEVEALREELAEERKDYALMKHIADRWRAEYERERKAKEEGDDELEGRIAALRKALEGAKMDHSCCCPRAFAENANCTCPATEQIAAIAKALEGGA